MQAVIFDLDGTLSDSLESIAYCANRALKKYGFLEIDKEKYKYFVGDGADEMIRRSLYYAGDLMLGHYEQVKAEYDRLFEVDCMYKVVPYEGILELLTELKKRNIKIAVLSNKPDLRTIDVVESLFGADYFDCVRGQRTGIPKKPSPHGVFEIIRELGVATEETYYMGDTSTDMKTGKSAGLFTIGVLWGFRDRKELEENNADAIISFPSEVLKYDKINCN